MTARPEGAVPDITVIVPVAERYDDLGALAREFGNELDRLGRSFEFVFVIDAGQRACLPALRALKQEAGATVRVFTFGRDFGEAAALAVGIEQAAGRILLTLAAYYQVTADGLEEALRPVESGEADLVVGYRHARTDPLLNRVQSRVFHWLARRTTATRFRDVSCGFRVIARETAREITLYGDLHRFIPILAANRGFTVREVPMRQHVGDMGVRFAGPGVYARRLLDLLTIFFLIKFTRKPLRFFGSIGALALLPGIAITLYLGVYRLLGLGGIAERPLLLLGILLIVLGVQSVSMGLLGEIIIFTHARRISEYRVAEIV